MRLFVWKKEREKLARRAEAVARFQERMALRKMYSPQRNPLVRASQGLLALAKREKAYNENREWTLAILEKVKGLAQ